MITFEQYMAWYNLHLAATKEQEFKGTKEEREHFEWFMTHPEGKKLAKLIEQDWIPGTNGNPWAGPASRYLRMRCNRPPMNCEYVKMLDYINSHPFATRKEVQKALGYLWDKNWQIFQAMMENGLICNNGRGKGFKHQYVITAKGQNLLKRVYNAGIPVIF